MQKKYEKLSSEIASAYSQFISERIEVLRRISEPIANLYMEYTLRDKLYPRPLLTFLGSQFITEKDISDITLIDDITLLFVPQLLRDYLAIHDDIIDEDLIKFNADTYPFAVSKAKDPNATTMEKEGKDISLLLGDWIIANAYDIVINVKIDEKCRIRALRCLNDVVRTTNEGQLDELMMNKIPFKALKYERLHQMYRNKAADYCFAFPFELGLVYSGACNETIVDSRNVLLNIGVLSQIINDLEGIFFEFFGNERYTLSDLLMLRRCFALKRLYDKGDVRYCDLLEKDKLNESECAEIKKAIIDTGVLSEMICQIKRETVELKKNVNCLVGNKQVKEYLSELIDIRISDKIARIQEQYSHIP